jgi:hypothetical protein
MNVKGGGVCRIVSSAALRKASVTSYYKAGDALWVKLVSLGDHGRGGPYGGVSVQVSR